MSADKAPRPPAENRLFAALPRAVYARLDRHLETVFLGLKDVLYEAGRPITHVYFPGDSVISLVSLMEDGSAAEVATVGSEGMVGMPVFWGVDSASIRAFVQIPGRAKRMGAGVFLDEVRQGGPLQVLLHRYTQALFMQLAQSVGGNRLHSIEQRCSRWLLMTHDRVGSDQFPLTQEFLSQMLVVRRASVHKVARLLQQAGLINYRRGKITILNRKGLESASCECYKVIKGEYDHLFNQYARGPETKRP